MLDVGECDVDFAPSNVMIAQSILMYFDFTCNAFAIQSWSDVDILESCDLAIWETCQ